MGPPRKIGKTYLFFTFFGPWEKMFEMAPNGARRIFVPTNPDLADILGDTDFDFDNFYLLGFFWFPNFWLGPTHLGPAGAHPLGPGLGPPTRAGIVFSSGNVPFKYKVRPFLK